MRKIVSFIIIVFLVSICFAMGERIKTWDPSVNTGEVYHEMYEIMPADLPRINKPGLQSMELIPLDGNKSYI